MAPPTVSRATQTDSGLRGRSSFLHMPRAGHGLVSKTDLAWFESKAVCQAGESLTLSLLSGFNGEWRNWQRIRLLLGGLEVRVLSHQRRTRG